MIDVIVIWLVSAQLINLKETYHARVITMDNNGIGKRHHSVFDGVSKQMVLLENHFFCKMGLFTLHNCCVSSSLILLKLKLDSKSRLTIPEFSNYHCRLTHFFISHSNTR